MSSEANEDLLEAVWPPARTVFPNEVWTWDDDDIYLILEVDRRIGRHMCVLFCLTDGNVFDEYPLGSFESNIGRDGAWKRIV